MATESLGDFFRCLTRGMAAEVLRDHSDRQLVERALGGQDEAAFQAITQRHGSMVYRVCWRVLHHAQDAEDAFQATFLVLAQKLRSVRNHASLASWLHGVAHRVALKAKAQAAARRRHERRASLPDTLPTHEATGIDPHSALDFELRRLPDKWRLPLILCYLEGRTQDESARQLGWSKRTLRRRLDEAREVVGIRLKGRGVVWSAALSAVLISDCMASAAPAPKLVASTVDAAASVAAGKAIVSATSAQVAALTEGVMASMYLTKQVIAAAVLLFVGLVAGAGGLSRTASTDQAEPAQRSDPEKKKAVRAEDEARRAKDELEAARADLQKVKKSVGVAMTRFLTARERYETAKLLGRPAAIADQKGVLVLADVGKSSVRVNVKKESRDPDHELLGFGYFSHLLWIDDETFPVSKGVTISQDNVEARLADLKKGAHVTLGFDPDGKTVAKITADGGRVEGPIRYVSANAARNTITVTVGKKAERKVYHLVKETEVKAAGKAARLQDLEKGATLLLTLSVEDANTVIRIEAVPLGEEKGE